jgi:hypothetical protein
MPTPFTHFTQSALSLRNFTQLYTALRISTHFTHFTQSSKTLGTLRTLRNLRELTYFTQLYSALRKAKILYATLRGGETLYASFTRRLRKVHLLYAHFTHTLRNFTQFNALYARPDYFTQLYAHGNLLMQRTELRFVAKGVHVPDGGEVVPAIHNTISRRWSHVHRHHLSSPWM